MSKLDKDIGKRIKKKREELHISQEELASGICNQSVVSRIEKGETNASFSIIYQLAKKLGIDLS